MNEIRIHLDGRGHPIDCHIDENPAHPVDTFILLARVPADPPAMQCLVFGNSDNIGRLLMSLYENCVRDDGAMAYVMELLARDIIARAEAVRGGAWTAGGRTGTA